MADQIVFLCPHGAAKSVIAAAVAGIVLGAGLLGLLLF